MLIADTHVHLYPCYDLTEALSSAHRNLTKLARGDESTVTKLLCLTERSDCHFFRDIISGELELPAGYEAHGCNNPSLLQITAPALDLFILAGRQLATAERLELLVLGKDAVLKDRMTLDDSIRASLDLGAVPVIPWSPGKWLGARGKVIDRAIEKYGTQLFLSDSSLRPWPIMSQHLGSAARQGQTVLAGSDPLPFAGEERWIGSYGVAYSGNFNIEDPLPTLKLASTIIGKRASIPEVVKRLIQLKVTASRD